MKGLQMPLELPPEIAASIPAEHISHGSIQRYNSLPELLKGHIELDSYRGRSIALPNGDADMDKWAGEQSDKLKTHGYHIAKLDLPPEKPDLYDFKVDGVDTKADKGIQLFKSIAHKHGLSNTKAQAVLSDFYKEIVPALQADAPKPAEFIEGDAVKALMQKTFGAEATQAVEEFKSAVTALKAEIPELYDVLNEGVVEVNGKFVALGDHPAIVKLVREVGKMKAQDFTGDVSGKPTPTGEGAAAIAEANDIMQNQSNPKFKLYWGGDKATAEYVESLYKKAYPGEVTL